MQQGWPMTSQAMCSAAWPARPAAADPSRTDLRHIGHFVMSSGHSCGAIERGASQNLGGIESVIRLSNLRYIKLQFAHSGCEVFI